MSIKITKITDFIYRNINNVWIMLNYKGNLIIENEDFKNFYEFIYNLWLNLWIWILFKEWKKTYILELYRWKSWAANNGIVYKEEEVNKTLTIIENNIDRILSLPLLKNKVEIIKDFKLFSGEIITQEKVNDNISENNKNLLFNILRDNVDTFLWTKNYKNNIENMENTFLNNINYEVDKFDWEEIYWKNIIIKNNSFFHYTLLFEDTIYKDLEIDWKRKKYSEFNIVDFIDDLNKIAKNTEFLYFKLYKDKIEWNNIVLDKSKWLYSDWFEKYNFISNLELLSSSSYKLMFVTRNVNEMQESLEKLEAKYNFKKMMRRDAPDNLTYLQDWNYIQEKQMYSNLYYIKDWLSIMKYYRNDWPKNIFYAREYFSKNDIKFTPHKLIPKNDKWTFERAFHNIIVWDTWSWKTYFAYHLTNQIIKEENTQVIYLDPLLFESQYLVKEVWEWNWNYVVDKQWNVIEVWKNNWTHIKNIDYFSFEIFKTPVNIIWYLTDDETERDIKTDVLFSILFWKIKLNNESKGLIKIKIKKYFIKNIWSYFNYKKFKEQFLEEVQMIKEENIVLYESIISSLELWEKIENILSLDNDLMEIIWNEKYVLFNLRNLFDANNFVMINVMFDLLKYVSKKNVKKYKYIFLDEIWNLLLKAKENWKDQIIINWIDWLLRIIRQFNWIVNMISQYYTDFKNNWLLAWVNMKIILDTNVNNTGALLNESNWKDKILEEYIKTFNDIKETRKGLITIKLWELDEAMIMDTNLS